MLEEAKNTTVTKTKADIKFMSISGFKPIRLNYKQDMEYFGFIMDAPPLLNLVQSCFEFDTEIFKEIVLFKLMII